jgi:hypothetical protein
MNQFCSGDEKYKPLAWHTMTLVTKKLKLIWVDILKSSLSWDMKMFIYHTKLKVVNTGLYVYLLVNGNSCITIDQIKYLHR